MKSRTRPPSNPFLDDDFFNNRAETHPIKVSKSLRFQILQRDGFRCRYCGANSDETELHVDHVFPVVHGGDANPNNLLTACRDCNLGKRTRIVYRNVARPRAHLSLFQLGLLEKLADFQWRAYRRCESKDERISMVLEGVADAEYGEYLAAGIAASYGDAQDGDN